MGIISFVYNIKNLLFIIYYLYRNLFSYLNNKLFAVFNYKQIQIHIILEKSANLMLFIQLHIV